MVFDAIFEVLFGALPRKVRWALYGLLLAVVAVAVILYLAR